jgi:hypothetical protein
VLVLVLVLELALASGQEQSAGGGAAMRPFCFLDAARMEFLVFGGAI